MSYQESTIRDFTWAERDELVYLGLGSNLESRHGGPRQNILKAFDCLKALSTRPLVVSSLWQTDPLECAADSPGFINAVAALLPDPQFTSVKLLQELQRMENEFGRLRTGFNAPRPLDLDILAYGRECLSTATLTLPHPRAHQRQFVLQPLAEIAPDYLLPRQTLTVRQLSGLIEDQGVMRCLV